MNLKWNNAPRLQSPNHSGTNPAIITAKIPTNQKGLWGLLNFIMHVFFQYGIDSQSHRKALLIWPIRY